jgi:hypothetical protein
VKKMRKCRLCGVAEDDELLGGCCGRCDEIAGDAWAGLALGLKQAAV